MSKLFVHSISVGAVAASVATFNGQSGISDNITILSLSFQGILINSDGPDAKFYDPAVPGYDQQPDASRSIAISGTIPFFIDSMRVSAVKKKIFTFVTKYLTSIYVNSTTGEQMTTQFGNPYTDLTVDDIVFVTALGLPE